MARDRPSPYNEGGLSAGAPPIASRPGGLSYRGKRNMKHPQIIQMPRPILYLTLLLFIIPTAPFAQDNDDDVHQLDPIEVMTQRLRKKPQIIDGKTLTELPGSADDPFRAMTLHPSIGTLNDFMGVLSVRGGAPGDNRYYLDRLPLAFPYHLLGIVSVVSADVIERIDVYPGGFDAKFGADSQAVIDIHSRPRKTGLFDGIVKVNPIYSEAFLGGKIGHNSPKTQPYPASTNAEFLKNEAAGHGYWYAFGRRSYLGPFYQLASRLVELEELVREVPSFWSYQLKSVYKLNATHGIVINAVSAYDASKLYLGARETHESDLRGPVDSDNPFDAQGVHLYSQFSPKLRSITSLTRSFSEIELAFGEGYFYRDAASDYSLRSDVTYAAAGSTEVAFGVLLSRSPTTIQSDGARRPEEGDEDYEFRVRRSGEKVSVIETSNLHRFEGYAQASYQPLTFLSGTLGTRLSYLNLTDSLSVQPRGALSFALGSDASLHVSYGRYVQSPRLDQGVLGNRNPSLTPSLATHYVVELEQELASQTKIYLAGYHKSFTDLVVYNQAERQYQNAQVGLARGIEGSVQHKISEGFEAWLSYAYTLSKRRDFPNEAERDYTYTRPHSVTAAARYSSESWHVSAKWQYMSGALYSPLADRERYTNPFTKAQKWVPIYGERQRTPPYHRLDLAMAYAKPLGDLVTVEVRLEIWNVYNRANFLQVRYDSRFTKEVPNYQLPIVPFLAVTLEF